MPMLPKAIFSRQPLIHRIQFLGPNQLVSEKIAIDILDQKTTALLLLLVIKRSASRKYIASKIWESMEPSRALANLRNHLYKNRKIFSEIVQAQGSYLRLADHVQTDIDFLLNEEPMPISVAIDAHRNQFLNGEDFSSYPAVDMFVKRLLEDYKSKAINTIYQELKELTAQGKVSHSIVLARRILLIAPLSESAVRLLMRLYSTNGDRAAAIDVYERFRQSLTAAYGIEPEQKTRQLHRELLLEDRFRSPPENMPLKKSDDTVI